MDVPHLRGLLNNDVLDKELVLVEAVDLGVGLGVLDEREQELGRPGENKAPSISVPRLLCTQCLCSNGSCARDSLDGPATLDDTVDLGLGGTADGAVVAAERNTLSVGLDVLKELDGLGERETTDSGSRLAAGVTDHRHCQHQLLTPRPAPFAPRPLVYRKRHSR